MNRSITQRFRSLPWLISGFVVALLWGELFTTILLPQSLDIMLDNLQADPVVGYIYEPHSSSAERGRGYDVPFDVNSLGLRDREIPVKQPDVYRVLLVGNSFSVSHGIAIESSFSRAVEEALNERASEFLGYRRVEVINAANAAYTANNYRLAYERWAEQLDPEAILVGFVAGREHNCDPAGTQYVVQDGRLAGRFRAGEKPRPISKSPIWKVRKFLAQNSHTYVLLRNYFYYNETIDRLVGKKDGNESVKYLRPYQQPLSPGVAAGWELAFSQLGEMQKSAQDLGDRVLIAAIPEITQVDPDYRADLVRRSGADPATVDKDQPFRMLQEFCAGAGIQVFELDDAVAEVHRKKGAYLLDNHWNELGIRAGANSLAQQWMKSGLPPFGTSPTPDPK